MLDDATAAGQREPGQWFQGQAPGRDWLFPAIDYNPRSPTSRIVVKHLPNDKLTLVVNGQPVDPLHYEGSLTSVDKTVAVSRWRGIGLLDGRNALHVEITDASGATVAVDGLTPATSPVRRRAWPSVRGGGRPSRNRRW